MAITNNEKEAIDIVVDMINKRVKHLIKTEPEAYEEILGFENSKAWILSLEFVDLEE